MRLPGLLAALGLWLTAGAVAADPRSEDWVGLNPFDMLEDRTFFEHPPVAEQLARLGLTITSSPGVRAPFKVLEVEGLLVAFLCDKRNCGERNWAFLLDQETGELAFCEYSAKFDRQNTSYSLTLSRSFLSSKLQLTGILSQALPNGCLDPGAANLAPLWITARPIMQ